MSESTLTKLMVVEDDDDIRSVAQVSLETIGGFTLCLCSSGPECLGAVPVFRPQLILLDVMMPGMDGMDTLDALRKLPGSADGHPGAAPVVFMTARVQPQEVRRYRDMGALDVIAKPFDPMTLADTIRQIWQQHVQGA